MRFARSYLVITCTLVVLVGLSTDISAAGDTLGLPEGSLEGEVHGYAELRAGCRTRNDPHEKDASVMEARLQLELPASNAWLDVKYKGDVWLDGVTEQVEYDTRELWFFVRPLDFLDLKIGRQVLSWGTGDLVFLNDLFPKDWRSFFIGRDDEYLKAPSDALKLGIFTDVADVDVVYTPRFDPDRYITGTYVSYWNDRLKRRAGRDAIVSAVRPERWFADYEVAVRLFKAIRGSEVAAYAYRGFWKTPANRTGEGAATFPRLNVYGASVRGGIGSGIGNIEFAWYQSVDNESGCNILARNSEMRYLVGYAREIGKDFNGALQYYVEQLLDYGPYRKTLNGVSGRDEFRHVITVQLTKLLMKQNLKLSLSGYYSPSDNDAYIRPNIHYRYSDRISLEAGANIFVGDHPGTFFSQFRNNTNIYTAVRYSF
ncbi:MAG TPA: hypothetical protein PLI53_04145 [Geobacteraceae bacterium]|nr:hypothetical protein [Geobacteraceae bacterium]